MAYVMNKFGLEDELHPISAIHGLTFDAKTSYGEVKIVPLYHPAVAVYNSKTLDMLKEDFKVLKDLNK
jgi:DNA polymerase